MRFKIILVLLGVLAIDSRAQKAQHETYTLKGKTYSYYRTKPEGALAGILLLFPGKGEKPGEVFSRTQLPASLATKGFVTIVPDLAYTLFADELTIAQIREILRIQSTQGRSERLKLALGGFSAGGALAISYAEHLVSVDSAAHLVGVFAIDPPLDLERLYKSSEWLMKYCNSAARHEAKQTVLYLHEALGGSPMNYPDVYAKRSPFLSSKADGGNVRLLAKIPVRMYAEPDLEFVQRKHCKEVNREDLNVTDLEKVNQLLRAAGNQRTELIITKDKGFHSWNIIEPAELANWISSPPN